MEVLSTGDIIGLIHVPIDTPTIVRQLLRGCVGAVATFEGVVRNNWQGRQTRFLDYEAYEPMALKMLRRVAEEARVAYPDIDRLALVHRLGRLMISETSVLVVVTAAHRAVAFDACRFGIDQIKMTVPIWKHEHFEDGDVWVEGVRPTPL
ncbi:MAG: molybdenum cofactor biosynthesis protein MoaE [Chloracidobacterium sp.]|uniref:Molybdopterin synthase catalytic subunit n=1 Tax=Chloracidobacterium validum TaxID=2821543 RepID=A0ABX8BAU3_9BACT|nr:molybdenum cofactor biosynthesis protein MoaE [Chloracidobacterium validum]QUW02190.1 molybdenum cofactor biosynthesis protein MoaE [Chloracidobacterium validum]